MPKYEGYDFAGWATRNDIRCSDGRTIKRDAFAHQDGAKVPLVWGHNHDTPDAVLGHGFLENRPEGVFFYGYFNDSDEAKRAKEDVKHGDITSLSIWANQLKQNGGDVLHGSIKEVSLVLSGANMGAQIIYPVVVHGEDAETKMDEAYIYPGDYGLELAHSDDAADDKADETENKTTEKVEEQKMEKEKTIQDVIDTMDEDQLKVLSYLVGKAAADDEDEVEDDKDTTAKHSDDKEEELAHEDEDMTVQDVIDTMNPTQKKVLEYLVAKAAEDATTAEHSDFGGEEMNFNAFDTTTATEQTKNYLSHSDEQAIIASAKKCGKLSDAIAAFAEDNNLSHDDLAPVSGFTSYPNGSTPAGVDALFPEYHEVYGGAPQLVINDQAWVKAVLNKVNKSPFSRIRTSYVDLRGIEEIRARGYAKGKEKALAGAYAVARRATDPQTVYVRSALNHDDVVDITDFDYIDYQYRIDRMELELELARAILIGDGREDSAADKIMPDHIRPIWNDPDLFIIRETIAVDPPVAQNNDPGFGINYLYAQAVEEAKLHAMIDFKGTGTPDMFCTQAFFNKLMLAKDLNGRRLYANKSELTAALDVGNVYNVPDFANKTRTDATSGKTYRLLAILGNLADYSLGQTKGGEIIHRTQFDIDFNQEKSLLETRVSGAVTRVHSFIVLEEEVA